MFHLEVTPRFRTDSVAHVCFAVKVGDHFDLLIVRIDQSENVILNYTYHKLHVS